MATVVQKHAGHLKALFSVDGEAVVVSPTRVDLLRRHSSKSLLPRRQCVWHGVFVEERYCHYLREEKHVDATVKEVGLTRARANLNFHGPARQALGEFLGLPQAWIRGTEGAKLRVECTPCAGHTEAKRIIIPEVTEGAWLLTTGASHASSTRATPL